MKRYLRVLCIVSTALLLVGLTGPAGVPVSMGYDQAHPLLHQLAAQDPDQPVSVIVQKTAEGDQVEKAVEQMGGQITHQLSMIKAFSAILPAGKALSLSARPDVRWVSVDASMEKTSAPQAALAACAPNTNYYLDTIGARPLWAQGIDGSGLSVAVIDSGISPDSDFAPFVAKLSLNPNSRSNSDVQGHGTHVSGIIAGRGNDSGGKYMGVAPGVGLISVKVSDETGLSYESDVVAGLQWVYENIDSHNIRVVNMSLNSSVEQSYKTSPINAAVEILWFNGVVVVVSAGNSGMGYNPINAAPANDPFVITVGATDEKCTSSPLDDMMGAFSKYGTTMDGHAKPDLLAPGYNIVSVLSQHSSWNKNYPERVVDGNYFRLSGTSMAAPVVTGAVALLLQYRPDLTPDQVKYLLKNASGRVVLNSSTSFPYLNLNKAVSALAAPSIQSANTGIPVSTLLTSGTEPVNSSVSWNSVSWNSVSWNSVSWNSVSWNSVSWNSVSWNSVFWGK